MSTHLSRKRKYAGREMVTLLVGPKKTRFQVYEDLLCESSDFFDTAFSSQFKEGLEKTMNPPDDSPEVIELFIEWLFDEEFDKDIAVSHLKEIEDMHLALQVYVFAEKIQARPIRIEAIHRIDDIYNGNDNALFTQKNLGYIYENTCEGSALRRLVVSYWTWHLEADINGDEHAMEILEMCEEFKGEAVLSMAKAFDKCRDWIRGNAGDPNSLDVEGYALDKFYN